MIAQQNSAKTEWKLWAALLVVLAGLVGARQWLARTPTQYERVDITQPVPGSEKSPERRIKEATMTPGRVVELGTSRGRIDFVLFEKDCPITTKRIIELVEGKHYDGVKFGRVEKDQLIQTDACKKRVAPMPREILKGLIHAKGAVGMARTNDPNSATSQFYILLEPWRHLDMEYTVFGRLIRGMDTAFTIRKGDTIERARIRNLTPEDRKLFERMLRIESERKTD